MNGMDGWVLHAFAKQSYGVGEKDSLKFIIFRTLYFGIYYKSNLFHCNTWSIIILKFS